MKNIFLSTALALIIATPGLAKNPDNFPRLLSMNIGRKHYDDPQYKAGLAKFDVVVLGIPRGWNPRHEPDPIGTLLRELKQLNPALKVAQYTILNEARDSANNLYDADRRATLHEHGWWLRNAAGERVQWTTRYGAWEINISEWAKPDAQGRRYPEWLAERENEYYFKRHAFDLWYVDNVMWRTRVRADWDGDGIDDAPDSPKIQAAFRSAQARHWAAIRALQPDLPLIGNTDGDLSPPEYRGQLDAAYLEHWIGNEKSFAGQRGWAEAMKRYRTVLSNLRPGGLVAASARGAPDDYRLLRFALASVLLDNGWFAYNDAAVSYSSAVWFDEYDLPLGAAKDPPPTSPWRHGVWRREFAGGLALVNPTDTPATLTLDPGWKKFRGKQAPDVNDGQPARQIVLEAKNGIVLIRDP